MADDDVQPPRAHRLAVYDLDRTVTRLPTWTPFLLGAAGWRLLLLPAVALVAVACGSGLIDRDRLKQAMHRLLLGPATPAARLTALADAFADRVAATGIRDGARAQIAADRASGHRIILATAAHRFYASAIAARLGIDDVIATEARTDGAGNILCGIDGDNCYGAAKRGMIAAWLARNGIDRGDARLRFYSDHASDVPTLEWADAATAVNPHRALRAIAAARGWPIVDWR